MAADDAAYKKAMRDLEAYIQEGVQLGKTRSDRLKAVLDEFWNYQLNYQLCAVEAAIGWAIAWMAKHDRSDECEIRFYAIIDALYASTPQAHHNMGVADLDQLYAEGLGVFDAMVHSSQQIYDECAKFIMALDPKAPARAAFTAAFRVLDKLMEHGSTRELQDMIWCCVIFCHEMRAFSRGIGSSEVRVAECLGAVMIASANMMKSVFDAVDQGRLLFKDGKFVKPDADKAS